MLQPNNYVNLFDFMYPTSMLDGLSNPCQINITELNIRYAVIRNNQQSIFNALNGIVTEADEGTYFREFMLPYSEVAAATRTTLTPLQLQNSQFLTGFDGVGENLSFSAPQTVFPMTDLGGQLSGEGSFATAVFSGGRLLRAPLRVANPADNSDFAVVPTDYTVRAANGGVIFYVASSLVEAGAPVDTLVLRNFNRFGTTWPNGAGPFTQTYGAAAASPTTFTVPDLGVLGNVYDISTYQVFCMQPGDAYYRLVDRSLVAGRVAENGTAIFTLDIPAAAGMALMLVPISGYWDYQWPGAAVTATTPGGATVTVGGPVTAETSQQFEIPLLEYDLATPAPVSCTDDVDVFVDGYMLRPHVDYVVDFGSPAEPLTPPRIVISGMTEGAHDIRCISNAPYDAAHSVQLEIPAMSDPRGLVQVPKAGREIRLMDSIGLLFAQGSFCGWGLAQTVGENLGLDLHTATSQDNVYYRARFCLTTAALGMCETAMAANLGLDKFLALFGSSGSSTVLSYDYQTAYAESAGIEGYSVPTGAAAPWAPPFETGYFWTRDRLLSSSPAVAGGAAIPAVTEFTDFSFDARIRGDYPSFLSWEEPWQTPSAGGVGFDCRDKVQMGGPAAVYGFYPDLDLDFRGAIPGSISFTDPPSSATAGSALAFTGSVAPSGAAVQIAFGSSATVPPDSGWVAASVTGGAWAGTLTPAAAGATYVWVQETDLPGIAVATALTVQAVQSGSTGASAPSGGTPLTVSYIAGSQVAGNTFNDGGNQPDMLGFAGYVFAVDYTGTENFTNLMTAGATNVNASLYLDGTGVAEIEYLSNLQSVLFWYDTSPTNLTPPGDATLAYPADSTVPQYFDYVPFTTGVPPVPTEPGTYYGKYQLNFGQGAFFPAPGVAGVLVTGPITVTG